MLPQNVRSNDVRLLVLCAMAQGPMEDRGPRSETLFRLTMCLRGGTERRWVGIGTPRKRDL